MTDSTKAGAGRGRALGVALGLAALAGLAWWALRPAPDKGPAPTERAAAAAPAPGPGAAAGPVAAREDGPRCPIPLDRDWHYLASASLAAGAAKPANSLKWQWTARAVRKEADGSTVLAARVAWSGESVPAALSAPDVRPPFLIRLGPDCRQTAYAWRSDADLGGARLQQALAARFAFVLPAQAATPTVAEACDENGKYRMAAVRVDQPAQTTVYVRNLGYAAGILDPRQPLAGGIRVDGAGARFRLDRGGWVESAHLEQWLQAAGQTEAAVRMLADLQRADTGLEVAGVDPGDSGWVWGNLLTDTGLGRRARLRADAELARLDMAALVAELQAADPKAQHIEALVRVLEAWLLANPQAVAQVQAWLQQLGDGYAGNAWARLALAALGRCGLPQARAALRNLGQDARLPSALRLHATLNLAMANGLDGADLAWLRERAAERVAADAGAGSQDSTAALSALGMAARQLADRDPALHKQVIADLDKALRDPSDPRYLLAAVNGAGNAADPSLLPALLPLSEHADSDIRRRVADALLAMPGSEVEALFGPWLAREDTPAVLVELVGAFAKRYALGDAIPAAVLEPAIAKLGSEANDAVTLQLVALVGKASVQSPAAKAALVARYHAAAAAGDAQAAAVAQAIGEYVPAREL